MQEDFLHYIWKFQYFDKANLKSDAEEEVMILQQGNYNPHAGPDFNNSKILINGIKWVGNVEIHCKSSDWKIHHHDKDDSYDNVILHVVWLHDFKVRRKDGTFLPTLELKNRINMDLLFRYKGLIENSPKVSCAPFADTVTSLIKTSMVEKSAVERLERKSTFIFQLLKSFKNDWEQVSYSWLMTHFGFHLNNQPFLRLSQTLPHKIILKHHTQLKQLEALLYGTAGFLEEDIEEGYPEHLKKEFNFLKIKYPQLSHTLSSAEWKFSKIRPSNFPTIRIAQLAQLLHQNPYPLRLMLSEEIDIVEIRKKLSVEPSDYWNTHYIFRINSEKRKKTLGKNSIDVLIINCIATFLAAYSKIKDEPLYMDKALSLLEKLQPEKNNIISLLTSVGIESNSALQSQGVLELYNSYCLKKKCLTCMIGSSILKSDN